MAKNKNPHNLDRAGLAAVRKQSRDAAVGKGLPGQFNPNRSTRFATADTRGRKAARGRTWRGE